MINWIIGGIIFAFTAYIIVKSIIGIRKGESCCSGNCAQGCHCDKKP